MGLGDPTPEMVIEGRSNTQGTCGGITGKPARFNLSSQESSETQQNFSSRRGNGSTSTGFDWNRSISHTPKPNSQLDSQNSHVNLKDFLTLFFTAQFWHSRAYSTSLGAVLVRNILYRLPELPCVVDQQKSCYWFSWAGCHEKQTEQERLPNNTSPKLLSATERSWCLLAKGFLMGKYNPVHSGKPCGLPALERLYCSSSIKLFQLRVMEVASAKARSHVPRVKAFCWT